ncbi:MAG TPA: trigger factor [Candidatus Kryptonia bacterium]|nr:trigger factor [Candidatus Kryptonia bacterium]
MIKVEVETVDPVRRRLAVEVPEEEVRAEIDRAYGELGRHARVRGFRPGRTPRPVLEQLFGDQVRADVFGKLIQQSYAEALRERGLAVVSQPQIVTERAEPGAALRYSATVEVRPEVEAQRYSDFVVERPLQPVSDADVDAYLRRAQDSLAQLKPIADRSRVQRGDVATIDYEARLGARLVGRGENRLVEVGRGSFGPDFDAQIETAEVGGTREITVGYPADHSNTELAGQTVRFHVTVKSLASKELPPLDDDFAKDHGECASLAELRARVRQQLEAQANQHADEAVRAALVEQLVKQHDDLVVPDAMVHRRAHALAEDFVRSMRDPRVPQKTEDTALLERLSHDLEPQARTQVKAALLLEAVARQEHLDVSDDDLNAHISELSAQAGTAGERVRALYQDEDARLALHDRLLQQRALDLVASRATITTVEASRSVADRNQNG